MSWVIEEITTSTIGFIIAMVVLSAIIGVGLYGYWVYANHVTLENYLWPIAEVLPYKGEYFLAIVNTGNEPFTIEQIYLKGGTVLTPNQAINPNLNWCSATNTKLMHNEWWCGMVSQLPVAVRVCSALDPQVCVVAPVHGWQVVTFSQPNQAGFGISNCPILASVGDPYNAGWEVAWTMAGGTYSVSESTSYQWCILPPYYPITINFQSTITSNPSNYQCQISPSQAQVNYEGKPETQSFTVTCQQQQQPPPPPPPPPPPGGNEYAYVYTDINAPSNVSWTVYLYFDGQLDATYQGSGSQSYGPAVFSSSGTVSYKVSGIPNTCSVTYSPSQSFTITPGNSYTETITITCQGQQPPPPQQPCTVEPPSVSSSPSGAPQPTSSASASSIPYGQSESVTFYYNAPESGNNYVFQYWSIGGQTYYQTNPSITETLTCTTPGQTLTGPSGTAYYTYVPPGSIEINPDTIDLTQSSETYTFTWSSAWSGTGTFTYSFSGQVEITYPNTVNGAPSWSATVELPGGTIAASGSGNLEVSNYPTPPNAHYVIVCQVSGSGTINGVSASGGSEQGTAYITCQLQSNF